MNRIYAQLKRPDIKVALCVMVILSGPNIGRKAVFPIEQIPTRLEGDGWKKVCNNGPAGDLYWKEI